MSLLYHASEKAESNRRDYSFILALVCMALAVVVASAIFTPAPVGAGVFWTNMFTASPAIDGSRKA